MKSVPVNQTIADYCSAFARSEVLIDKTYQRSPEVWPSPARSYLIETIIKGFPIPKLALHQVTDLKSRRTIKYVIDGQQRSQTIRSFFQNDLRLSRSLEAKDLAGKIYDELADDYKQAFLSYVLNFDQFEAASDEEVREYFRRINSFTAPLNGEEQRHARYQGPMKWFIYSLTERFGEALVRLGVLPPKSVVRMADAKFLAEIIHALVYGVSTTSKKTLDTMYRAFDTTTQVPEETRLFEAVDAALNQILAWEELRGSSLMRTHVFYSLIVANVLATRDWEKLRYLKPQAEVPPVIRPEAENNLLRLAAALDQPELFPSLANFVVGSGGKTNVKSQREIRIRKLFRAITSPTI